jgi:hypothetical protein
MSIGSILENLTPSAGTVTNTGIINKNGGTINGAVGGSGAVNP